MAGLDRASDVRALSPPLAELFQLDPEDRLKFIVGNDATLLSVPMIADHNGLGGVAVVSGGITRFPVGQGVPANRV